MKKVIDGTTYKSKPELRNTEDCSGCIAHTGERNSLCETLRGDKKKGTICAIKKIIWVKKKPKGNTKEQLETKIAKLQSKLAAIENARPAPRIVCAAIRHPNTKDVVIGVSHSDNFMRRGFACLRNVLASSNGIEVSTDNYERGWWDTPELGFVDQFGEFHSQEDAWDIAFKNNQIVAEHSFSVGVLQAAHLY